MINVGYIEATLEGVVARVYYNPAEPVGPSQPLVNGPRGFCLDLTNVSGRTTRVVATLPSGSSVEVMVGQGDPVTGGPPSGRSRTLAQMQALGFSTRGDVQGFSIA
jgi:hypothetical protein